MKNGTFRWLSVFCTVLCLLIAARASAETLTKEQIKAIMYQHVESTFGYTKEELTLSMLEKFGSSWSFTVIINDHPYGSSGVITGAIGGSGTLISINPPDEYPLSTEIALHLEAGIMSPEQLTAFREAWEPRLDELTTLSQQRATDSFDPIASQAAVWLIPRISQPGAGELSPLEAAQQAQELLQAAGWNAAQLELYALKGTLYLADGDEAFYLLLYMPRKRTAAEMSGAGEKAFNAMMKDAQTGFGGIENTPYAVSVRMDAKTGELLAPVLQVSYEKSLYHLLCPAGGVYQ